MKTFLLFVAFIAIFVFAWAQVKPEFLSGTTTCKSFPIGGAKYCDGFNNPADCTMKCSVSFIGIFQYCYGQLDNYTACLERFYFPYSPETVQCPLSENDFWKYCERYPNPVQCKDECTRRLKV